MHGSFVEGLDDAIVYNGMRLAKKIPAINRACGGDHKFFLLPLSCMFFLISKLGVKFMRVGLQIVRADGIN
jgi:hypothetical protein